MYRGWLGAQSWVSPLVLARKMRCVRGFDNREKNGRIIRQGLMILAGSLLAVSAALSGPRWIGGELAVVLALRQHGCLGVDGGFGRHAGAQQACQALVVEYDLDGNALHDLGEIAGGVVGRQ